MFTCHFKVHFINVIRSSLSNIFQHNSITHLNISLIDSIKHVNIDLIEYTSAYGYQNRRPTCSEIARHLFSVGLPRSACAIVSIVNVRFMIKILASHIPYESYHTVVWTNTRAMLQRRPKKMACFAKPIGMMQ